MIHDDPPEFTGTDHKTAADPKGKRTAPPVKVVAPLKDEMASPVPPVAIYTKPTGPSHPKHAVLGPAIRLNEAEAALNIANAEQRAARDHLTRCEAEEADALSALIKAIPGPTYREINEERLAKIQAERAERVGAGLPADAPQRVTHGNSELDRLAASRPRRSATPLQPNTVRRSH